MYSSSDESMDFTLEAIKQEAAVIKEGVLPEKSREKYMQTYEKFMQWKNENNTPSFSENVFLAYFSCLAKEYKPNTLWAVYSMLRATIRCHNNIDIKMYFNLVDFLKQQSERFKSTKPKTLSVADVQKFINEAPDDKYLAIKVALIFGVSGACRRDELTNITIDDVEDHGETFIVKIRKPKSKMSRSFAVPNPFYDIVNKYISLRSPKAKANRFFLKYQNGKCTAQCIGINKFGGMPKEIATYLGLPDPALYTGHSFRRTSEKMRADARPIILP